MHCRSASPEIFLAPELVLSRLEYLDSLTTGMVLQGSGENTWRSTIELE